MDHYFLGAGPGWEMGLLEDLAVVPESWDSTALEDLRNIVDCPIEDCHKDWVVENEVHREEEEVPKHC